MYPCDLDEVNFNFPSFFLNIYSHYKVATDKIKLHKNCKETFNKSSKIVWKVINQKTGLKIFFLIKKFIIRHKPIGLVNKSTIHIRLIVENKKICREAKFECCSTCLILQEHLFL